MIDPVAEARSWIGTPYRHQASAKAAGCDCLGLIRGIWQARYGAEPEALPGYTADWSEPGREERLLAGCLRHLLPVPEARPGDVLVFRMQARSVAKHMGILAGGAGAPTFIHAYSGKGVVESPLSAAWGAKIAARFRFP